MKSVEFTNGKYATNNSGDGLFRLKDGAYQQLIGNGQINFKSEEQFLRYLRRNKYRPGSIVRSNWD